MSDSVQKTGAPSISPADSEDLRLLLDSVHERSGIDFREYTYSSLRRRVARAITDADAGSISGLHFAPETD